MLEGDQAGAADIQMRNNAFKTEPAMTHMVIPTREFNTLHETSLVNTWRGQEPSADTQGKKPGKRGHDGSGPEIKMGRGMKLAGKAAQKDNRVKIHMGIEQGNGQGGQNGCF